jgi:hypothetical protein
LTNSICISQDYGQHDEHRYRNYRQDFRCKLRHISLQISNDRRQISSKVMDSMSASPWNHKSDKKLFWTADLEEIAKIAELPKSSKIENLPGMAQCVPARTNRLCRLLPHKSQLLNG